MSHEIEHTLCQIVREHGTKIIKERTRLCALISDYCPGNEQTGHRNLLRAALEEGIGDSLLRGQPCAAEQVRLTQLLIHNRFTTPEAANMAVGWFMTALGYAIASQPVASPIITPQAAKPQGGSKTGDVVVVDLGDGVKLEMVYIEPGTFLMGSPEDEEGHKSNETQHRVTLTNGFWMGKYPVTQSSGNWLWGTILPNLKGL